MAHTTRAADAWTPLTAANDALAFGLELAMLAALAYWGIRTARSRPARFLLGVGAPTAAAVVWGVFLAAGGHPVTLPTVVEAALKLVLFGTAAAGLVAVGRRRWGRWFAVLAVVCVVVEYGVRALR